MPIYEYECTACGHRLEALQKLSDEPLGQCPDCGKSALKKLVSAAGFRLKGTGWYETDFKHKGADKAKSASKDGAPSADKTASSSSDSKSTEGQGTKATPGKNGTSKSKSSAGD